MFGDEIEICDIDKAQSDDCNNDQQTHIYRDIIDKASGPNEHYEAFKPWYHIEYLGCGYLFNSEA